MLFWSANVQKLGHNFYSIGVIFLFLYNLLFLSNLHKIYRGIFV